jgi:hypothetical protein
MSLRKSFLVIAVFLMALVAIAPAASAQGFLPITPQTLNLKSLGAGTLTAIKVTSVQVVNGNLVASGLATVNTATGTAIGSFTNQALSADAACPILHLTLGPIHLNLLGLVVNTNQIVLDITAVSAPGNLLGNLLCAVANLLNQSPVPTSQIAALLNEILTAL